MIKELEGKQKTSPSQLCERQSLQHANSPN